MYTESKDNLKRHFLGSIYTVFVDRVSHGLETYQLPPKIWDLSFPTSLLGSADQTHACEAGTN